MEPNKSEAKEPKQEIKTVYVSKNKRNPWVAYTIILALVIVIMAFFLYKSGGLTGGVIGKDTAGQKLADYLNSRTGGGVELVSSEEDGNLYKVTVSYQGSDIPVYITKD